MAFLEGSILGVAPVFSINLLAHRYITSTTLYFRQYCSMAVRQQSSKQPARIFIPSVAREATTERPTTTNETAHPQSFQPYTTLLVVVVTNPVQLKNLTSISNTTNSSPLFFNSSITTSFNVPITTPSTLASSSSSLSLSRSWPYHTTQALSETQVPKEWGPKDLDVETGRQVMFLLGAFAVFVITMVLIIGAGVWKSMWRSRISYMPFARGGRSREDKVNDIELRLR
ncbi:hypothetical protein GQ44DRAFT_33618 [Phaeosphaeriaceae sp. PMI808]|nr:hypothetical protein GQ44DRAFT_33618 [Phaeosphaeriaceae sp. PMI808]